MGAIDPEKCKCHLWIYGNNGKRYTTENLVRYCHWCEAFEHIGYSKLPEQKPDISAKDFLINENILDPGKENVIIKIRSGKIIKLIELLTEFKNQNQL